MDDLSEYDAVVVGGGFFGCQLSIYLKQYLKSVLILEREEELLQRASYHNQARVHNGYHYPRSILTALRSRVSFPQFIRDYQECIYADFEKYYAVGKLFSKVNANQFKLFCDRIGSPLKKTPASIKKLFSPYLVEEVFCTKEYAFDAVKLKHRMLSDLLKEQVILKLNAEVIQIEFSKNQGLIAVKYQQKKQIGEQNKSKKILAKYVFNCTYSGINDILKNSNLPMIPLKHELTEMALIEVPQELNNKGITIMCGPFFSLMPFPSENLHTLSHVRYTPHCYWQDTEKLVHDTERIFQNTRKKSNYPHMIRDAKRYLPILQDSVYIDSLWEVKTVLPQSETDDSRPILCKKNHGMPNLTCILGGKIDNVYDIPAQLNFLKDNFS